MNHLLTTGGQSARQIGAQVMKFALTGGLLFDVVLLIVLAGLTRQQPAPTEELTKQFLSVFEKSAPLFFTALLLYSLLQYLGNRISYPDVLKVWMRFALGSVAVVFATKVSGDALIRSAEGFPDLAALVAFLLAVFFLIFRYAVGAREPRPAPAEPWRESAIASANVSTLRDVMVLSVHEAAHALLFAAWPAGVLTGVIIRPELGRGQVTYKLPNASRNKQEVKFQLLGHLAGRAGEQAMFQTQFLGAEDDLEKYSTLAPNYLALDGVQEKLCLLPAAKTPEEVAYNASVLHQLRSQHFDVLTEFFRVNWDLLDDLAAQVRERLTLDGPSVQPYLERVVLTAGLPAFEGAVGQVQEEQV